MSLGLGLASLPSPRKDGVTAGRGPLGKGSPPGRYGTVSLPASMLGWRSCWTHCSSRDPTWLVSSANRQRWTYARECALAHAGVPAGPTSCPVALVAAAADLALPAAATLSFVNT